MHQLLPYMPRDFTRFDEFQQEAPGSVPEHEFCFWIPLLWGVSEAFGLSLEAFIIVEK